MNASSLVYEFKEELHEEIVESRLNRFLVQTKSGKLCHLHDPGRLKELIYPGNKILVRQVEKGKRKTSCQVTAAWDGRWVITDSSIHNAIARKFLPGARQEVKLGKSRIDFFYDNTYVEVKGCTLVNDGVALFPDAPTERGRKHLEELIRAMERGMRAKLLVLVMRDDAVCFSPNAETDRKFAETFYLALTKGLEVEVKEFKLEGNKVYYVRDIPLCGKG
ncbi:DNA/RNA nuclease SfsA [Acidianus infernus]|uniref:Sugar fermentation stimulation protein homolog n=1 Tax=Acidianus infernus TaxID=12915 RepID=A0A6A9QPB6_ACIIN|nr:DNA/RNA nuclease SfsA [Acidianus infernus]MUM65748.1 DNA/RNA nuclease SfsA [Acidianus infernus]